MCSIYLRCLLGPAQASCTRSCFLVSFSPLLLLLFLFLFLLFLLPVQRLGLFLFFLAVQRLCFFLLFLTAQGPSLFFFFLPSILLSGFMFPFRGMPDWAQWLGEIFPLTHFLRVIRAIMLKGADLPAVAFETGILVLFILIYAGLALMRFRRTLD